MKEQQGFTREIFNSDGLLIVEYNFVLNFSYDLFELKHKTSFFSSFFGGGEWGFHRYSMNFLNLSRFLTVNRELD